VSRYQKGKTNLDLLEQEIENGSGINRAMCKSVSRSSQITMPAPNDPAFYRLDALPATQPTASSKHRRHKFLQYKQMRKLHMLHAHIHEHKSEFYQWI